MRTCMLLALLALQCVAEAFIATFVAQTPQVLTGVQLAPGLEYRAGRLEALMPNLIKGRGVELMRIPRSNYLSQPLNEDHSPDARCSSVLTQTHITLALRLLNEKENLPGGQELLASQQQAAHAPLHRWSDNELKELQSASLQEAALAERTWLKQQHAGELLESCERPLEIFLTAVDAVRTHSLPCSGSLVLAPATTLLQRSVPRGATAALESTDESIDLVIKGDGGGRLDISGGWLTNNELLLSAGWALADSSTEATLLPHDLLWDAAEEASVTQPPVCELSPSEWGGGVTLAARESREKVLESLRRFRYIQPNDDLAVLAGGLVSDTLGSFMQALCVSQEELALFGVQGCAVNIGETVPFSRQHETRVGMALAGACRRVLASLPTSLAEDEALLESIDSGGVGAGSDRKRQALHSRLSTKRALNKCRERCEIFVALPTATATLRRPWKVNIRTSG